MANPIQFKAIWTSRGLKHLQDSFQAGEYPGWTFQQAKEWNENIVRGFVAGYDFSYLEMPPHQAKISFPRHTSDTDPRPHITTLIMARMTVGVTQQLGAYDVSSPNGESKNWHILTGN